MTPTTEAQRRVRRQLLLLVLVGIAPIVASYALYHWKPRQQSVNYGTLLATPAPELHGARLDGAPFALADMRGRWVMVTAWPAACTAPCPAALYAMRQSRTMQNADQDRVARVWLVTDDAPPGDALLREHPGLVVAHIASDAVAALPGGGRAIYLVDPRGNLVLAWPADPDIKSLAGDLARLLRASQIG